MQQGKIWFKPYFRIGAVATCCFLLCLGLTPDFFSNINFLLNSENPARNTSVFVVLLFAGFGSLAGVLYIDYRVLRYLWFLILGMSAAASQVKYHITGNVFDLVSARLIWNEASEITSIFTQYWFELLVSSVVAVVFVGMLCLGHYFLKLRSRKPQPVWRQIFLGVLPMAVIGTYLMVGLVKGGEALQFNPEPYRALAQVIYIKHNSLSLDSASFLDVTAKRVKQPASDKIILIVDESIRSDYGFNDWRKIENFIPNDLHGKMYAFSRSYAQHTCSQFSNVAIRWGLDFRKAIAEKKSTIWQYAKAADMQTTYIDSQRRFGQLQNMMNEQEASFVDNFIQFNEVPQVERNEQFFEKDLMAAQNVNAELLSENKSFVMVNKLGAHFPYEGKYPLSEALYKPHMDLWEVSSKASLETRRNSYKNAVQFNLSSFFGRIFSGLQETEYTIIYTSDHGQNLENINQGAHCTGIKSPKTQALVPLVVFSTNKVVMDKLNQLGASGSQETSNRHIFPTLLWLMGYDDDVIMPYGKTLFDPATEGDFDYRADDVFVN